MKKQAKTKKREVALSDYEKQEEVHFAQEEQANIHTHAEEASFADSQAPTETSDTDYYKHVGKEPRELDPAAEKSRRMTIRTWINKRDRPQ